MITNRPEDFNFNLGETTEMIRESVASFSQNEIAPRAAEIDKNDDLIIDSKKSSYNIDSLIFMYIKQKLVIAINGNRKELSWVGKEIENDITWCYLEIINVGNFSKVSIENKLFLAIFDDQLNICHFYCSNKTETLMLHKETPYGEIMY